MRRRTVLRHGLGGLLLAGLAPLGGALAHSYRFGDLAVGHIYAPPTGSRDIAVYGPLVNMSDRAMTLTGARVPGAGRVRFRRVEDGRAVWLDALDLLPNRPLALAPWREHLWVEGLPRPPAAGESFALELAVEGGPPVTVEVMVEEAGSH